MKWLVLVLVLGAGCGEMSPAGGTSEMLTADGGSADAQTGMSLFVTTRPCMAPPNEPQTFAKKACGDPPVTMTIDSGVASDGGDYSTEVDYYTCSRDAFATVIPYDCILPHGDVTMYDDARGYFWRIGLCVPACP